MAKSRKKSKQAKEPPVNTKQHQAQVQPRITLQDIDAISSDEETDGGNDEWDAEALALRQAISEGKFDHLLDKTDNIADDDEIVEVDLDEDEDESISCEEAMEKEADEERNDAMKSKEEGNHHSDAETDDEEGENGSEQQMEEEVETEDERESINKSSKEGSNGKALAAVYDELRIAKKGMPWPESFSVVPETPLPFGGMSEIGTPLDVHDDLKRELAFYNIALEAANEARMKAQKACVPFSRPEDFFAEMVKTDSHMAKVKDRLIFETKKMDAVAQRKSNKEQQLRAKEKQSNKLAEKAKRKKEHFKDVDDWAKTAAKNRGTAIREDDNSYLDKMTNKRPWTDRDGSLQTGPNKKRMVADKKYGFGGKKGRFKQNDPKEINDMSTFNPKGNFGGLGSKSKGIKQKGGSGANRQGKRARDSTRSRR